jgi:hypothetical protein
LTAIVVTDGESRLLIGHTGPIWQATFSHDGSAVLPASDDQSIRVWDATSGQELQRLSGIHDVPR